MEANNDVIEIKLTRREPPFKFEELNFDGWTHQQVLDWAAEMSKKLAESHRRAAPEEPLIRPDITLDQLPPDRQIALLKTQIAVRVRQLYDLTLRLHELDITPYFQQAQSTNESVGVYAIIGPQPLGIWAVPIGSHI